MSIHAVDYRPDQKTLFQAAVREVAGKLEAAGSEAQAQVHAGEVIDILRRYNRDVETFVAAKAKELQSMVAMLTDTVVQLCGTTAVSVHNLVELERDLESADEIEDIQLLKVRLSAQLKTMRREVEDQQQRFEQLKTVAEAQIHPQAATVAADVDRTTGLPGPAAAEAALHIALQRGTQVTSAVFVIERLKAVNDRYGFAIGDEILAVFSRRLLQRFPNDAIFRWRGPSFLLILETGHPIEVVRREIQRAIFGSLEHTARMGTRSVLLPIHWSWTLFPVTASTPVAMVLQDIDHYVAKQFTMSA